MLAADAHMHIRAGSLAQLNGHFHQLAYAVLIQLRKGIVLQNLGIIVSVQELA